MGATVAYPVNVTGELSRYLVNLHYDDIPPGVLERAKSLLLHTIGVSLAGTDLKQGRDVIALAKELSAGDAGTNTLLGDGARVSWEAAAFAAGAFGDLLDWEDCASTGHPSSGVIPAAVTGAEALHVSGRDVLTAIVAGYELGQRIGLAADSNINGLNVIVATVVFSKLLGFDEQKTARALSLAAAQAAIPNEMHSRTMSESLNYLYGLKVMNAVTIVRTVALGLDNPAAAFDVPDAYTNVMRGQNPKWYLKDLGEEYLTSLVLVKHWPANFYVQTYVELADKLRTKYSIDPDEIDRIVLDAAVEMRWFRAGGGKDSLTLAEFSIPYCVAAYFYYPKAGSIWYQPETLHDPRVLALQEKMVARSYVIRRGGKWKQVIQGNQQELEMTVILKDGTSYTESLFTHKGNPSYMFTREEFHQTFREETEKVLSPEEAETIIQTVQNLEKVEDAAVLGSLLYHRD